MTQYEGYMPYAYGADSVESVNAIFRKVYQYMALGLIITALTVYITASSTTALRMLFSSQAPVIIIALAEVALVIYLSAAIHKLSASAALSLFLVYSVLNGITFSVILLIYTRGSVYQAFISTAAMFGVMSVYGLYTKRDLTSMGSFLRMGVIGLLVAMIINIFVGSSMVELTVSILGIIIFMGLTAYDTAKIKSAAEYSDMNDSGTLQKIAVIGALQLYLDFINIFLYLLRLFGKWRD